MFRELNCLLYSKDDESALVGQLSGIGITTHCAQTLGDMIFIMRNQEFDFVLTVNQSVDQAKLMLLKADIPKDIPFILATNEDINITELPKDLVVYRIKAPVNIDDVTITMDRINHGGNIRKVLVVEDEEINQEIIADILKDFDYEVTIVGNACEALHEIRFNKPDLILLDYQLPDMNGDEILYWLRSKFDKDKLPVIIVSSQEDVETVRELAILGANGYVVKPYESQKLIEKIMTIFEPDSKATK